MGTDFACNLVEQLSWDVVAERTLALFEAVVHDAAVGRAD